jgi:hypothetical protein
MKNNRLKDSYELYFSHQCDARSFNRGATKNIGFLAVKSKYPNDYKKITFVFNDIDTIPFSSMFDYETVTGTVKHFYGFNYALGGIVSVNGEDFEKINGFPNFWGWGMEDNVLQSRCERNGLQIDRSQFFPIGNPNILHLFDGIQRIINRKDPWRATHDDGIDGLRTIHKLSYTIDLTSTNPLDNVHMVKSNNTFVVNISTFMTGIQFEHDQYHKYDLREPPRKIIHPDKIRSAKNNPLTDDWSNIPFYPTAEKKKEMIKKYGKKNTDAIIQYSYEHSVDPNIESIPPTLRADTCTISSNTFRPNSAPPLNTPSPHIHQHILLKIKQYNDIVQRPHSITNKYSPEYAKAMSLKPKATTSANIGLGGVRSNKITDKFNKI